LRSPNSTIQQFNNSTVKQIIEIMKKVLHKWLLAVMLGGFAGGGCLFAQYVDVNRGTEYTIASTVDASGASTYQWLENGVVIAGATATAYTVPTSKPAGVYRYIRQAKSEDCLEWQSSNEFVVSVVGPAALATLTPYIDPRDGKMYQTVKMPDGKVWFAQNLNYTKGLYYNTASNVANGVSFTSDANGAPAIGSYWCPPKSGSVASGGEAACNIYGALYTWETVMMVDGKYADDTKTSITWEESWVSGNYYATGTAPSAAIANINNARGGGRGICPPGWHVPTDYEWAYLLDKVDGNGTSTTFTNQSGEGFCGTNSGVKLKSAATYTGSDPGDGSWQDDANRGTNATGFGATPAGIRYPIGQQLSYRGTHLNYWSSSVGNNINVWYRYLLYSEAQVYRRLYFRSHGFSVRCVRN
jgi:uncharacterized protein (TIGR02145 family)